MREWYYRGVQVLWYFPENAYLVAAEDSLPGGRALRAAEKISPWLNQAGWALAQFHPDVADADAREILRQAGVEIREHLNLRSGEYLVRAEGEPLTRLTEWDEVAYVYPAAAGLVEGKALASCRGVFTPLAPAAPQADRLSEGWDGPGLGTARLGWFLVNAAPGLQHSRARSEILRALGAWSKYVQVDFQGVLSALARRSVAFRFAAGAHGDGYPFDGPGGVAAHTFYPVPLSTEPLAGDVHFDAAEDWSGTGEALDLFSVALHETGHALGLNHSDRPGTVMYPYYRRFKDLTATDAASIRELYAVRAATPEEPGGGATPAAGADTTPPLLKILTPASGRILTYAAAVRLRGLAGDEESGIAEVGWRDTLGHSGRAQGTTAWECSAVPVRLGITVLTVYVRDGSGNETSRSVSVTRK